jgi:hypothetical protein
MNTKALVYKAETSVWNCIRASSKIALTSAQQQHRRFTKMIPVGMRKQAHKALPTFQEMASQRIAVLDAAIAALNSREDANSKKLKKLAQHLAEKADLEQQLSQPLSNEAAPGSLIMYVNNWPANLSPSYSWKLSISANVLTWGLLQKR